MPPALTVRCPREPFSKPRRINPCYTHDSSGHALNWTPWGCSSHYSVYNTATFQPWAVFMLSLHNEYPPHPDPESYQRKRHQLRQKSGGCVHVLCLWDVDVIRMEGIIKEAYWKDDSIWMGIWGWGSLLHHSSYTQQAIFRNDRKRYMIPTFPWVARM